MRPKGQIFDLKRFRTERKVTQKELSELLARPQSFLSAIEHGKRSAPPGMLDMLAEAYKVENISDYLSDPPQEPDYGDVRHVHDAIVNSPGGVILMTSLEGKLGKSDLMKLLNIIKGLSAADEQKPPSPHPQSPPHPQDTAIAMNLVELLKNEQARNIGLEKENKELRAEIEYLREQLPKRKK